LLNVALGYLNVFAHQPQKLVLERQDPQFKRLERFLNKVRVQVQTGPRGQRSRVKTIRGLEPMAGEFEFINNKNRPTKVKVKIYFFFVVLNLAYPLDLITGLFLRNIQYPD